MTNPTSPLILASGSPRRKDLLGEAGYEFVVIPPQEEEVDDPSIPIGELTQMNAMLKADCVAVDYAEAIVIAEVVSYIIEYNDWPLRVGMLPIRKDEVIRYDATHR